MASLPGIEWPQWLEASTLTTAPPLLPCFALANQIDQEVPITQSEAEADTCSWRKAAKREKILDYMSDFFLLSNYPVDAIL